MLLSSTIILFHQRSCSSYDCPFNRSIVPSFQVLSPYQVLIQFLSFSIGVLPEVVLPCSSFLTECFSTSCISVVFFFSKWLNLSRFFGFTRLSKKQLSFTSSLSLPLSLRCHSGSRDEIISQWWSVVTPRDRCARCRLVIRCCCLVSCLCVASCHVIMCIASSCFRNLHPSGFPPVLSVVRSEPNHTCTR